MFVDEEIGMADAGEAQHGIVEVFDPAANGFTVTQLDGDGHLAFAEGFEIEGFLAGFAGRRGFGTTPCGEWWCHDAILDAIPSDRDKVTSNETCSCRIK